MKKLAFGVQVFGLIAMFPVYILLEMNHGTERSTAKEAPSVGIEKPVLQSSVQSAIKNNIAEYALLALPLPGSMISPLLLFRAYA